MHKNGGYDVQVINALVMHVGVKAIVQLNKKQVSYDVVKHRCLIYCLGQYIVAT